jgi:hypothetical protein
LADMEPEKFLIPAEFNALLSADGYVLDRAQAQRDPAKGPVHPGRVLVLDALCE